MLGLKLNHVSKRGHRAFADRSGISGWAIWNRLTISSRLLVMVIFTTAERSTTVSWAVGNGSATGGIVYNHRGWSETNRQTVSQQSTTPLPSQRTILLKIWSQRARKSSWRPSRPCNLPATCCWPPPPPPPNTLTQPHECIHLPLQFNNSSVMNNQFGFRPTWSPWLTWSGTKDHHA